MKDRKTTVKQATMYRTRQTAATEPRSGDLPKVSRLTRFEAS